MHSILSAVIGTVLVLVSVCSVIRWADDPSDRAVELFAPDSHVSAAAEAHDPHLTAGAQYGETRTPARVRFFQFKCVALRKADYALHAPSGRPPQCRFRQIGGLYIKSLYYIIFFTLCKEISSLILRFYF